MFPRRIPASVAFGRAVLTRGVRAFLLGLLMTPIFMPIFSGGNVQGQSPRVSAQGMLPADFRLAPLKDLDGYFPFTPPSTLEQWQARSGVVRRQLQTAVGLWPMPERTPLNAVIHGKIDGGDYTVEKVYFESLPGFFVSGNLYRPKNVTGKVPGVLCPHGHWSEGRFYDCGLEEVQRLIQAGAESSVEEGRSPLQARCVHLARMGAVVFHYDMIGYADSQQISAAVAHGFAKQRPEMNTAENWGLFSPQAESHLQSVMGLQTYSSIRALDFLQSLEDVDAARLGVTGASGGGTQTFILAALDDRLATAFPAVMVSTAMQGGCTCENCCLLRVGTGNIEIAALFAPKPQGMTAADDWTREMETKGFPELKQLYALYNAADQVQLTNRVEFGHNYNQVSRVAMYELFQGVLGLAADFEERPYKRLSKDEMTVWNTNHPRPEGGDKVEREIISTWHRLSGEKLRELVPTTGEDWDAYAKVISAGIQAVIGRQLRSQIVQGATSWELVTKTPREGFLEMAGWIIQHQHDERLPVVFLYPESWNGKVVVWLTGEGKDGLYSSSGSPREEIAQLVSAGCAVLGADLLYQGEFLVDGKPLQETPRVANPRESAGYTQGYNYSVAAQRVHDVMTLIAYLKNQEQHDVDEIQVVGLGAAGPVVATAAPFIADQALTIYAQTGGFRYVDAKSIRAVDFLPGGARYFDLPGFISLAGATKVVLAGEPQETVAWLEQMFACDQGIGTIKGLSIDGFPQACVEMIRGQ